MNRLALASLCCLSIFAMQTKAIAQDKPAAVKMAWKFKKGQVIRYKNTTKQEQTVKGSPMGDQSSSTTTISTLEHKIMSVDEKGVATIRQTTVAVKYKMSNPAAMQELEYDSTKEEDKEKAENPSIKPVAATVGTSITYTMNSKGEVLSVKGSEKIGKKIIDSMGDGGANPQVEMMKTMLKEQFSNKAKQKELSAGFKIFSDKAVTIGDTWTNTKKLPLPMMGSIVMNDTMTYKKDASYKDHACAQIDVASKVSMKFAPKGMLAQIFDFEDKGTTMSTQHWFSKDKGILLKTVSKMTMNLGMNQKGGGAGGLKMTQTMATTTTQEMISIRDGDSKKSETPKKRPTTGGKKKQPL